MVFKKMLGALGVGGPSVDTVLDNPNTRPGLALTGKVNLTGGNHDVAIEHITLSLVTRIEVDGGDSDYSTVGEFHRAKVSSNLSLRAGQQMSIPFELAVPWETPITDVYGQRLRGMVMGVRTEVAIARAVDKGDLDPISVHPLPVQEKIVDAFARLGFRFKNADLEYGRIAGVHTTLPFYQEIEYFPAPAYAHGVSEVELTFVANPQTVDVILELDKRGGMFTGGHDSIGRYTVSHTDADSIDWAAEVDGWLRQAIDRRQGMLAGRPGGSGYGPHGGRGGHGRRSGMGGALAGAALGLAGGMVAGEMIGDAFEDDGGEGDEG